MLCYFLLTGHLLAIWLFFFFFQVNVYSDNLQLVLLADTPVKSSDCGKYVDTHMEIRVTSQIIIWPPVATDSSKARGQEEVDGKHVRG